MSLKINDYGSYGAISSIFDLRFTLILNSVLGKILHHAKGGGQDLTQYLNKMRASDGFGGISQRDQPSRIRDVCDIYSSSTSESRI